MATDPLREFAESVARLDQATWLRERCRTSLTVLIERAQNALAHADALAADRPVREWRAARRHEIKGEIRYTEFGRYEDEQPARSHARDITFEGWEIVVQAREVGPWQDVTDEGDGDA
ncbi:MAG TPA: hypothetical protein VFF79_13010 [Conexibacter sp.]|jgi:hypothetical protein|nr:hypothetical protein [Conexibacter sp.]